MNTSADTPPVPAGADTDAQARPSLRLVLGIISVVAVGGMAGSLVLGGPPTAQAAAQAVTQAATPEAQPPAKAAPPAEAATPLPAEAGASGVTNAEGQPDPELMVARLAERMKKSPDPEGLAMLGRAYTVMGHEKEAVEAYRRAVQLSPKDAQAHAELGRALGNANGRRFTPESEQMLRKAVELDGNNVMAHALLGKLEIERNHRDLARGHWQQALAAMSPQHPFAEQLRSAIAQLDQLPAGAQPDAAPAAGKP